MPEQQSTTTPLPHDDVEQILQNVNGFLDLFVTGSIIVLVIMVTASIGIMLEPKLRKMNKARINKKINKRLAYQYQTDLKASIVTRLPITSIRSDRSIHINEVWKKD